MSRQLSPQCQHAALAGGSAESVLSFTHNATWASGQGLDQVQKQFPSQLLWTLTV